jgi:ATP-dependent Lon protease
VIEKKLGMDKGGKEKTIDKFRKRAEKIAMPEHIKVVFEEVLFLIN